MIKNMWTHIENFIMKSQFCKKENVLKFKILYIEMQFLYVLDQKESIKNINILFNLIFKNCM